MSNTHFKEKKMSLKSKGLLSLMLSLPDDWDYSIAGLASLSKDGKDSVMSALAELEKFGYLTRKRLINDKGQFAGVEYYIFENPVAVEPNQAKEKTGKSDAGKPAQYNTNSIKDLSNKLLYLLNTNDTDLLDLYKEYISIRENIKSPLTEQGLERLVKRAKKLSKGSEMIEKEMLEASIRNNWKDIYLPREEELKIIQEEGTSELRAFYGLD